MSTTTDILDTTIPEPAWVLDPTYDSELNPDLTHSRASAGRMVSDEGKYVSRASGVERVPYGFDGDPGLLVEAANRTNHVPYSSDISVQEWGSGDDLTVGSAVDSIIEGENAYPMNYNGGANFIVKKSGNFSSNEETMWGIVEENGSSEIGIRLKDRTDFDTIASANYVWANDALTLNVGIEANRRILANSGPNGGKIVLLSIRYNPTSGTDYSGRSRQYQYVGTNSGSNIAHHAQIEEAPTPSSPTVTDGSATTRAADDFAIFSGGQPDWWNPNEGTFFVQWVNLGYKFNTTLPLLGSDNGLFLGYIGNYSKVDVIDSSSNFVGISGSNTGFETHKAALSMTPTENRISVNGASDNVTHDGSLLQSSECKLGHEAGSYKRILYFPRALSESTLNTLTS